jgi:hypothetical protein
MKVMIKFNQLKEVLLQGEMEILEDEYIDELNRQQFEFNSGMLYRQFQGVKTLLDLVHIYEDKGYETYDANEKIINTIMQLATFD